MFSNSILSFYDKISKIEEDLKDLMEEEVLTILVVIIVVVIDDDETSSIFIITSYLIDISNGDVFGIFDDCTVDIFDALLVAADECDEQI
ncbi:5532_t:CDS:2 [Diversispora eburnea]|uniref:5532_t:CDS:1 n=1 Tax=Diversispora eburnea TaxID=1213867 RepID=A0A9N9B1L8_9GLOM|nr:5532_t:CDS:2 [Diversispora eburnea]